MNTSTRTLRVGVGRTKTLVILVASLLTSATLAVPGSSGAASPADAEPPGNYIKTSHQLSKPVFKKTAREVFQVPMQDDVRLYVEVVRPDPKVYGSRRWPVIMEASPYHGTLADRDGTRIFPDPKRKGRSIGLTGYFAPRGYAVVMVDLRGTGRSQGCLDHLGPNDADDLKRIVEWAAGAKWSNGRVGLTGHSYVGSTPSIAAAQRPKGLVTIAPSAGLASMYDHQFQKGVPYFLQWVGPMVAYEEIAIERHLPGGDNFGNDMTYFGCGAQNSAATAGHGQANGEYQEWHAERDWRAGATRAPIPIFMIHGVNDNAARIPAAEWFFGRRFNRAHDKVWLGQWDHGSSGNTTCSEAHVNCRFEQWQYALHAWFDKHLQRRNVDTGPPVEVFLNGKKVWTDTSWSRPDHFVEFYADAGDENVVSREPGEESSATFTAYANDASESGSNLEFRSAKLTSPMVMVGLPQLQLNASLSTSQILNLIAIVEREDAGGERHPMTHCAIQPQLREGIDQTVPVTPGEEMALRLQCFTMAHRILPGERIVLNVRTTSRHHASTFSEDARVSIFTGPEKTWFRLPIVGNPTLYDDVPLRTDPFAHLPPGPAQESIEGTVVAGAPGAGNRNAVTSTFFEFDVTSPANATMRAAATFLAPGDFDFYLQRRSEDGEWTGDLASGTSGSLSDETLRFAFPGLRPGHYRLEVHNWAGPPSPIDVVITFFDKHGKPG